MADGPVIVIPAGLENDPAIVAAMRDLALTSIAQAKDLLLTSAPMVQSSIIRLLLPQVSRAISQGTGDDDDEFKATLASMYGDILESIQ